MINRRNFLSSAATAGVAAVAGAVAVPAAAGSMAVRAQGTFEGRSNHITTGGVKIVEEDGRTFVVLADDFSLDGGPDPRVAFGKGGEYAPDGYLGALLSLTGEQKYAVPPTWKLADFDSVYIWCEVAGVPLGVASLK